jgi:hypothetical protein
MIAWHDLNKKHDSLLDAQMRLGAKDFTESLSAHFQTNVHEGHAVKKFEQRCCNISKSFLKTSYVIFWY